MKKGDQKPDREERRTIAAEIKRLSNNPELEVREEPKRHIALKIGVGNFSNAAVVSDSGYVKFFIRSNDLLERAQERYKPELVKSTGPWAGFGYRFWGLRLNDIQANEALFRALIKESMDEIEYRRRHVKKR